MKRTIIALCILLCIFFIAAGCEPDVETERSAGQATTATTNAEPPPTPTPTPSQASPSQPAESAEPLTLEEAMENTIQATITMEDGGVIVLELYPDLAPQSVRNFVFLAREGYYDGLKFHRIIKGFMIQGGCPLGTGTGNPGYSIMGEFAQNGFTNDLLHTRGVISMARSGDPNSAGSQFFLMHADAPSLDGAYAAFGRIVSGLDVVDRLANTPNSGPNGAVSAENMPVISTITIDSDIELPEPDRIK